MLDLAAATPSSLVPLPDQAIWPGGRYTLLSLLCSSCLYLHLMCLGFLLSGKMHGMSLGMLFFNGWLAKID